jgi:hypothetical protein
MLGLSKRAAETDKFLFQLLCNFVENIVFMDILSQSCSKIYRKIN